MLSDSSNTNSILNSQRLTSNLLKTTDSNEGINAANNYVSQNTLNSLDLKNISIRDDSSIFHIQSLS